MGRKKFQEVISRIRVLEIKGTPTAAEKLELAYLVWKVKNHKSYRGVTK